MSVDTKAIIRKDTTIEQIKSILEEKYGEVQINSYGTGAMVYLFTLWFKDEEKIRQLSVFFGEIALNDYQIDGVLLSLGCWGNSVKIMNLLLNKFGGYLRANDCDDKDWEAVNLAEFEKSKEILPIDLFKNKVISKLGYDKLKDVMELFEEYKQL